MPCWRYERDGVLWRRITSPASLQRHQLLLPAILRERTLRGLRDEAGHQGVEGTEALVRERCYWVGLRADVKPLMERCEQCAVAKMPHIKTRTPMGRLMATRPLQNVLGITDVFTKFTVAVVTRNQRADNVAKALVSEWFTRYGVPQRLQYENGRYCQRSSRVCRSCTASSAHTRHRATTSATACVSDSTERCMTFCAR